jgi:hypothetical protein
MSTTGFQDEFVDALSMTLTNVTDDDQYQQITNLVLDLKRTTWFKSLMDARMERLYGVADNALEFDITLTIPEVIKFVNLTAMVDQVAQRILPDKIWRIAGVSKKNTTFRIDFSGAVVSLRTNKPNLGASTHHIRIEASTLTVTVT